MISSHKKKKRGAVRTPHTGMGTQIRAPQSTRPRSRHGGVEMDIHGGVEMDMGINRRVQGLGKWGKIKLAN